ncbi:MAG: amino acid kinase [Candidatus Thiodiazotropha sp.]
MWVVKLGGSLFHSKHLRDWLKVLADSGPLVVVPGGGPFADQVRQAQQQLQFDDSTAHLMALLAMEQFGHLLCGLQPGLTAATNQTEIDEVLAQGDTPVWMPTRMVMADPAIQHSWDVTSDSLAAWLARQLCAKNLLLVKSLTLGREGMTLEALRQRDVVDSRFGDYLKRSGARGWIGSANAYDNFKLHYRRGLAGATAILD